MPQALGRYLSEHIADVRRPITHADAYRHCETLCLQERRDAMGLLHGQGVEGRKASQVGIVCGYLSQARLRAWALADDGPHKAHGFTPRTGREALTAPRGGAPKPYKQHTIKMGGDC